MEFERLVKLAGGMAAAQREFPTPYHAGRDCGLHGANMRNCHFGFFGSKESMQEWERGKASVTNPGGVG
jgi:hypothetical protein